MKAVLSYTAPSMRLDDTIDLIIIWYVYIRKAAIRLKSFGYYRALNSDCSIILLLVWMDSLVIRTDMLLGSKLVLGMSCLGIFRLLLAVDWVPARKLLEANRVYTA